MCLADASGRVHCACMPISQTQYLKGKAHACMQMPTLKVLSAWGCMQQPMPCLMNHLGPHP